ncbi:MAG: hypothetical protein ACYCYP_12470 [Leptospirales bacterium]
MGRLRCGVRGEPGEFPALPKDLYYMACVRINTRILTAGPEWVLPE